MSPVLMLSLVALLAILAFMVVREVKRAHWTLLETLLATLVLGHVIAFFCVAALRHWFEWDEVAPIMALGIAIAMAMAFGAFWVFRDLAEIGEKRTSVRIFCLFAGLLLLPSLVAFPFNLFIGWILWLPLAELHGIANCRRQDWKRRHAPVRNHNPAVPHIPGDPPAR